MRLDGHQIGRLLALLFVNLAIASCATVPSAPGVPAAGRETAPQDRGTENGVSRKAKRKAEPTYQRGVASWYGKRFHGRTTASGVPYDMNGMTAAHRTLPFGTRVKVTRISTGRSVVVTINDRGPYAKGRIIDLSRKAAASLGFLKEGKARVRLQILR